MVKNVISQLPAQDNSCQASLAIMDSPFGTVSQIKLSLPEVTFGQALYCSDRKQLMHMRMKNCRAGGGLQGWPELTTFEVRCCMRLKNRQPGKRVE